MFLASLKFSSLDESFVVVNRFLIAEHHDAIGLVVSHFELSDAVEMRERVDQTELTDEFLVALKRD